MRVLSVKWAKLIVEGIKVEFATFAENENVKALMDTRYLQKSKIYKVFRIVQLGGVTSRVYWLEDAEKNLWPVKNGHIVLGAVDG